MSAKISETFSKGMDHLKTGQDKVVEYVPLRLSKWSIFAINFYFAFYSGWLLFLSGEAMIIGKKFGGGIPKDLSFFFLLLLSILMFASFVLAMYAIFSGKPNFIRTYCILIVACFFLQICMDVSFHIQEEKIVRAHVVDNILLNFDYLSPEEQEFIQTIQQKNKCCGSHSHLDYFLDAIDIPSSCCGKYNKKVEQVGDCSESELKSKPGCGYRFNKFFRAKLPNLNNPSQARASSVLYPMAILMASLAWIFSLQVIKKREDDRARTAAAIEQGRNRQTQVFTVSNTLGTTAEGNPMASPPETALSGTSFR